MNNTKNITLSGKITDILEQHDFTLLSIEAQGGEYIAEMETYSPNGEDFICDIWFDGTEADFIKQFKKYAESFDVDEHAGLWIEARGKVRGVPDSIRDLIVDAEAIKNILMEVTRELESEGKSENNSANFIDFKRLVLNKCREWEIKSEDIYFNQTKDNYYADYKPGYPNKTNADFTITQNLWDNTVKIYGNFGALIPTVKSLKL